MYYTSVHSIVRNVLIQKNLPMHYYIRFLSWALDAVRDLELDAIGAIKSVTLSLNDMREAPLPCDYVDWVRCGTKNGQFVLNNGITKNFNRQLNQTNGVVTPYQEAPNATAWANYDFPFWERWYNEHGEVLGELYGGTGTQRDEFMIIPERGVIAFSVAFVENAEIVFDYIPHDTTSAEANVHRYAEGAVQAWMEYRYLCHVPNVRAYDKREAKEEYDSQVRKLFARINDLTPEEVIRVKDRRFKQSPRLG